MLEMILICTSSFVDLLIGLETLLDGQPNFRKFSCESHRDDVKS